MLLHISLLLVTENLSERLLIQQYGLKRKTFLANATKWIFIGYSLPEPDFELKHLIKSAELRLKHKKMKREIDVVIYHDTNTQNKFQKFFGTENVNIFDNGLSNYVSSL